MTCERTMDGPTITKRRKTDAQSQSKGGSRLPRRIKRLCCCHEETEAGTTSTHRRCDSWLLHIYFPVRSLGMLIRLGANTTTTTSTSTNCRPPAPTAAAHLAAIVGVLLGSCARLCNEGRTSDDNVSGGDDCAVCCRWWR